MTKKIVYFYDSKEAKVFLALGQMVTLLQACYFRGKELCYDKVVFEWHNLVAYPGWSKENTYKGLINTPKNDFLPITFVQKGNRISKLCDRIDLSEPDSLYNGCPPIMTPNGYSMQPTHEFLNRYYENHHKRPILYINKEPDEKYILFHYRESTQERQIKRNTSYDEFKKIFTIIKEKYGDKYKLKKIGEPCDLDKEFDEVYDYFPDDIESLFKVINDSFLFVGGATGPVTITFLLGVKGILLLKKELNPVYIGRNSPHEWVDESNYLCIFESDESKIIEFIEKL